MEQDIFLSIANDFTKTPGGRCREDGEFSGEQFRKELLAPKYLEAVRRNVKLVVDLDGVAGYATSFLEEAFGGLVREMKAKISDGLRLQSENQIRIQEVRGYIADAEQLEQK